MAVTVMELASHVLGREATTGRDYNDAGLPMLGGCEVCGATVAAYNSYPSTSGFLRCGDHIGDEGWDTVEAAERGVFIGDVRGDG